MAGTPTGVIDSPKNARVVAARALATRKGRRSAAAFLVEGPHAVHEVVAADGFTVRELFITDAAAHREVNLLRRLAGDGIAIHTVSERVIGVLGDTVTPQGVIAVIDEPSGRAVELPVAPLLVAVLDRCADPGNAGTAIRTCDAAGADAVVLGAGSVDAWSGKSIRASAGSVFHLPVITAVASVDAVEILRDRGCRVLATAADGEADLDELTGSAGLEAPTAWVFGSEASGLDPALRAAADRTVRIPIHGRAESLNLAASVAICMYASARAQRHGRPDTLTRND